METWSANNRPKSSLLRRVGWILGILVLGFLAYEASVLFSAMAANSALRHFNPATTAFIDRYSQKHRTPIRIQWKTLDQISNNLKRAVIVAEDDTFFTHEGLNFKELKISWMTNWKKKKAVRGGSTISMQLVKNLYLSPAKNPLRKLNEIFLAMDLEKKLSKTRILEIYLNVVEWGDGVFGVEAASLHYYQKDPSLLNAEESAFLAAILPNPVYLTKKNPRRVQYRKRLILNRLHWTRLPAEVILPQPPR